MSRTDVAALRPIADVARDLEIAAEHLEPYGRDKAKVRLEAARGVGPAAGQADPGLGDHADAGRRGEDDDVDRPGPGPAADRQARRPWRCGSRRWGRSSAARGGRPAAGPARSSPRTRSTSSSPATSTRSPPRTTCWPRRSTTSIHFRDFDLDPTKVLWKRVLDMNDRALRHIVIGLGGRAQGIPRESGFDITAASEVMAILCLADSPADLRARLDRILVGFTMDGEPVLAEADRRGRLDGRDPERGDPAQPGADAPSRCRRSSTAARSPTSPTAATRCSPRGWPWRWPTTP